jgi:hypothetical protein
MYGGVAEHSFPRPHVGYATGVVTLPVQYRSRDTFGSGHELEQMAVPK